MEGAEIKWSGNRFCRIVMDPITIQMFCLCAWSSTCDSIRLDCRMGCNYAASYFDRMDIVTFHEDDEKNLTKSRTESMSVSPVSCHCY